MLIILWLNVWHFAKLEARPMLSQTGGENGAHHCFDWDWLRLERNKTKFQTCWSTRLDRNPKKSNMVRLNLVRLPNSKEVRGTWLGSTWVFSSGLYFPQHWCQCWNPQLPDKKNTLFHFKKMQNMRYVVENSWSSPLSPSWARTSHPQGPPPPSAPSPPFKA